MLIILTTVSWGPLHFLLNLFVTLIRLKGVGYSISIGSLSMHIEVLEQMCFLAKPHRSYVDMACPTRLKRRSNSLLAVSL